MVAKPKFFVYTLTNLLRVTNTISVFCPKERKMSARIRPQIAQQIVETIKDFCGHDINFIDTNGTIFASTNASRVGSFHEIGKTVVTQGKTIQVDTDTSFSGTQKGVNIPVSYHGEIVAAIGISGEPSQVVGYAQLACKVTRLLLWENELESQRSTRKQSLNYVLQALTRGNELNHDFLINVMLQYNVAETDLYRVVLIRLGSLYDPSGQPTLEQEIYQCFRATGSDLYTFIFPNEYLLCLPQDQLTSFRRMAAQLVQNYGDILKIGVGTPIDFVRLDRSYSEAQMAIRSLTCEKGFAVFDDLDLDILLTTVSDFGKKLFLEKVGGNFDEQDRHLLEIYFDNNFSLNKTAEALFLHKNTIQYQLDRIQRRYGYNPREFRDAVVLYLRIKLQQ